MRVHAFFLGTIWLLCGRLVVTDAISTTVEPALLERKAKFSFSKKGGNKESSGKASRGLSKDRSERKRIIFGIKRNKYGGVDKAKSRGSFWRRNKKDKSGGKQKGKKIFFNSKRRKGDTHDEDDRKVSSLYKRGRKDEAHESKRERHHHDVTDALHNEIEADQHEEAFIEDSSSTTLKEAAKHVKDRLTKLITKDITDAMQELDHVH